MSLDIKSNSPSIYKTPTFQATRYSRLYRTSPLKYSQLFNKLKRPSTIQIKDRSLLKKRLEFYPIEEEDTSTRKQAESIPKSPRKFKHKSSERQLVVMSNKAELYNRSRSKVSPLNRVLMRPSTSPKYRLTTPIASRSFVPSIGSPYRQATPFHQRRESDGHQLVKAGSTGSLRSNSTLDIWKALSSYSKPPKLFIIEGNYPDIRNALLKRGWLENPDDKSSLFDLKWTRVSKLPRGLKEYQMINHLDKIYEISTKYSFCDNIKRISKISRVDPTNFFPRCYKLNDSSSNDEFYDTFKVMKAISILNSYSEGAEVPKEKIVVSINVCERWVREARHKFAIKTGYSSSCVMSNEWRIISTNSSYEMKSLFDKMLFISIPNNDSDILIRVRSTLRLLKDSDPQYFINGEKNIWIVKPGRKSRGRDIAIFSEIDEIKKYTSTNQYWVIQKYIENPLIISRKKVRFIQFDIRQWVLVGSVNPLTIWIYEECYLRFSVEDYELEKLENLYIHLTNNSIAKKSEKFVESDISGCMWHVDTFKEYLISKHAKDIWTEDIQPHIKSIIKWSLQSVAGCLGNRKNSFELLGYDFMIDENFTPWLIEVNTSPAMDYSTVISI